MTERPMQREHLAASDGGIQMPAAATSYAELEAEHQRLTQLYLATAHLTTAAGFRDVVSVVGEILVNFVGSARHVLYLFDARSVRLVPVASEGCELQDLPSVALGEGIVGEVAARKLTFSRVHPTQVGPIVAVPVASAEDLVGVLVLEALLPQKADLTASDHDLLSLLSTLGGAALAGAFLRECTAAPHRAIDVDVVRSLLQ
jgi:hypothetical protein